MMKENEFGDDAKPFAANGLRYNHTERGIEQKRKQDTYINVRNSRAVGNRVCQKENCSVNQWNRNDEELANQMYDWSRMDDSDPSKSICNQVFLNSNTDIFHELKQEEQASRLPCQSFDGSLDARYSINDGSRRHSTTAMPLPPKITVNKFQIQNSANFKKKGLQRQFSRNGSRSSSIQQRSSRVKKEKIQSLRRKSTEGANEEPAAFYRQIASDLDIIDRNTEQICQRVTKSKNRSNKRGDQERQKLIQLQKQMEQRLDLSKKALKYVSNLIQGGDESEQIRNNLQQKYGQASNSNQSVPSAKRQRVNQIACLRKQQADRQSNRQEKPPLQLNPQVSNHNRQKEQKKLSNIQHARDSYRLQKMNSSVNVSQQMTPRREEEIQDYRRTSSVIQHSQISNFMQPTRDISPIQPVNQFKEAPAISQKVARHDVSDHLYKSFQKSASPERRDQFNSSNQAGMNRPDDKNFLRPGDDRFTYLSQNKLPSYQQKERSPIRIHDFYRQLGSPMRPEVPQGKKANAYIQRQQSQTRNVKEPLDEELKTYSAQRKVAKALTNMSIKNLENHHQSSVGTVYQQTYPSFTNTTMKHQPHSVKQMTQETQATSYVMTEKEQHTSHSSVLHPTGHLLNRAFEQFKGNEQRARSDLLKSHNASTKRGYSGAQSSNYKYTPPMIGSGIASTYQEPREVYQNMDVHSGQHHGFNDFKSEPANAAGQRNNQNALQIPNQSTLMSRNMMSTVMDSNEPLLNKNQTIEAKAASHEQTMQSIPYLRNPNSPLGREVQSKLQATGGSLNDKKPFVIERRTDHRAENNVKPVNPQIVSNQVAQQLALNTFKPPQVHPQKFQQPPIQVFQNQSQPQTIMPYNQHHPDVQSHVQNQINQYPNQQQIHYQQPHAIPQSLQQTQGHQPEFQQQNIQNSQIQQALIQQQQIAHLQQTQHHQPAPSLTSVSNVLSRSQQLAQMQQPRVDSQVINNLRPQPQSIPMTDTEQWDSGSACINRVPLQAVTVTNSGPEETDRIIIRSRNGQLEIEKKVGQHQNQRNLSDTRSNINIKCEFGDTNKAVQNTQTTQYVMTTQKNDAVSEPFQKTGDTKYSQITSRGNYNDMYSQSIANAQQTNERVNEKRQNRFLQTQEELSQQRSKSVPLKMTMLDNASKIRTEKFENLMSQLQKLKQQQFQEDIKYYNFENQDQGEVKSQMVFKKTKMSKERRSDGSRNDLFARDDNYQDIKSQIVTNKSPSKHPSQHQKQRSQYSTQMSASKSKPPTEKKVFEEDIVGSVNVTKFNQIEEKFEKVPNELKDDTKNKFHRNPGIMNSGGKRGRSSPQRNNKKVRIQEELVKSGQVSRRKEKKKWLRIVHMLMLTIAEHECNIEEVRQDLCASKDFQPQALFRMIDIQHDDQICKDELKNFIIDSSKSKKLPIDLNNDDLDEVTAEILKEFDSDYDGFLNFQEFLNIFLPAANENLRQNCIMRIERTKEQRISEQKEVSVLVIMLAQKIIMYEKSLAFLKLLFRRKLQQVEGFEARYAFEYLFCFTEQDENATKEQVSLDVSAIKNFLESSLVPKLSTMDFLDFARKRSQNLEPLSLDLDLFETLKSDQFIMMKVHEFHIEAIRRRCDHDCDGMLNFHEFNEILYGVQVPQKAQPQQTQMNYYEDDESGSQNKSFDRNLSVEATTIVPYEQFKYENPYCSSSQKQMYIADGDNVTYNLSSQQTVNTMDDITMNEQKIVL